ncbi:kinase-like domain-containing protein [Aspergillus alliaceus]|uniref:Kinase-like domain-containing protein n=1 Tax=Petromyces alliaceus TaxID=209559 RepID=A0A5N7CLM1_PETAA|nr:kinase-like domain-containing protein [Aspergillus alliaceus]
MSYPIILYPERVRQPILVSSESTIISMKEEELFSSACIEREKYIYQYLPKHKDILECLDITETGLRFPYMQNGHLRDYIRKNFSHIDSQTKDTWRRNTIYISARNFLVADNLSIKLCDFAGSGIDDMPSITFQTDLFALGCLIFEILVGSRPYEEISDEDWETIAENYDRGIFPQCWTSQYTESRQLLLNIENVDYGRKDTKVDLLLVSDSELPSEALFPLGLVSTCILVFCISRRNK